MRKYLFLVLFFFSLLFSSCKERKGMDGDILKPEKMEAVLWDFYQADAYTQQYIKKDSLKNPLLENALLQQKIFLIYGINKEDFYNSYHYYSTHVELMKVIMDSIAVKAERKRSNIMMKKYTPAKSVEKE